MTPALSSKSKGKGRADALEALGVSSSPGSSMHSRAHSSSDSHSDSDESTASLSASSDNDSDFGPVDPAYLQLLLEKAKANMAAKKASKGFEEAEEIQLEGVDGKPLPSLEPSQLPPSYFEFGSSSMARPSLVRDVDAERLEKAAKSVIVPDAPPPPPELKKDGIRMTKRERKAQKQKNAGPGWFDLPAPDAADLPRLYREVEALRLRNTLDPKRFYRKEEGEGKGIKGLPKHFAIGTVVPTSTPFGTHSSDNLTRAERKRTIVDELVDDSEAKRYAKKKFIDLQTIRGAKGRGTLAKKKAARKPRW